MIIAFIIYTDLKRNLEKLKITTETLDRCHSTVGIAILNTSITIVFGFSILVLSNFIPTIYFGVFTGIAMLLAMTSVLTLLPKLILTYQPFGKEKRNSKLMFEIIKNFIEDINLFDVFFCNNNLQCNSMFFKWFFFKLNFVYEMGVIYRCYNYFVPKLQPVVSDYIQSEFINSLGLGIAIFVFTLFIIILIGKTLSKAVTWTGVGSIDKVFGFLFGFFKGYVVSICLFFYF